MSTCPRKGCLTTLEQNFVSGAWECSHCGYNDKSWLVIGNHVIPDNDLQEHAETNDCWCLPKNDGQIVIHNSADERELYERGERKCH